MKKKNNKKVELLAPAGGVEQFIAAVENGADAIYLGGRSFNARMKAGNFDDAMLVKAVDFAHKRGVDVHVAMNILLRDDELRDALEYATFLYETGVDALIVQDLGLASLIYKNLPDFPLHLSTQGTVYSLDGVKAAERMGFRRVVLSRELSCEEIKFICANTETEIETFVHGAICICYSGQCQLSRAFGGRSGNRGECAQPCRLKYNSFDEDVRLMEKGSHALSPKDLSLIDHLGKLVEAGVASLKIEGRMKSPEYVGVVVGIYRKYLDEYYRNGYYEVSAGDRNALEQIFNRGGFTDQYFKGNSDDRLMSKNIPKHNGILIGEVKKKVKGTDLVDVKLFKNLSLGDGIEIRPQSGKTASGSFAGNIVTYYKELPKGLRIGDLKGTVNPGDLIYRISEKEQLDEIRRSYKGISLDGSSKEKRKTQVDIIAISQKGKLRIKANHGNGISCEVETDIITSDKTLNIEKFIAAMKKSGNTPFEVKNVRFTGSAQVDLKVSEMNYLRRSLLEKLAEALVVRRKSKKFSYIVHKPEKSPKRFEKYFYDWESYVLHRGEELHVNLPVYDIIPIVDFERHYEELKGRNVIPYISNVSRGSEESFVKNNLEAICTHCKDCGIYIGNIGWLEVFRGLDVSLYGDYGLNVCNEETKDMLKTFGIDICAGSLEGMTAANGRYPLMVMEHRMREKILESKGRKAIRTIERQNSDQTIIVFKEVNALPVNKMDFEGEVVRYYF